MYSTREVLVAVLIETQLRREIILDDGGRHLRQWDPVVVEKRQKGAAGPQRALNRLLSIPLSL